MSKLNIVIIGYAATGKTTLTDKIKKRFPAAKFYATDDYIKHGFEEGLYVLMDDLRKDPAPFKIIEGILGYRLLRKGAQMKSFYASGIVDVLATREERQPRIEARGKNLKATFNLDSVCRKVLMDYHDEIERIGINLPPTYDYICSKDVNGNVTSDDFDNLVYFITHLLQQNEKE